LFPQVNGQICFDSVILEQVNKKPTGFGNGENQLYPTIDKARTSPLWNLILPFDAK